MINLNVFSQILSLIDRELFKDLVAKQQSDKHQKGINNWTHLGSMLFCHFFSADSVRDISKAGLGIWIVMTLTNKFYLSSRCFAIFYIWGLFVYNSCGPEYNFVPNSIDHTHFRLSFSRFSLIVSFELRIRLYCRYSTEMQHFFLAPCLPCY